MHQERRNELIRALGVGLTTPAALAVAGWPGNAAVLAAVGLAGALVGLLLAFIVEHGIDRSAEIVRLENKVTTLQAERDNLHRLNALLEHRAKVTKAESEINAIGMKVFNGAFIEAQQTGHFLPVSALMARMEVEQKAKGLDKPIPPPDLP